MPAKRTGTKADSKVISDTIRIAVIHGGEEMIKKLKLRELRDTLESRYGEIEPIVLDGETAALSDVLDELRSYSLLQSYKIVIVDNADQFMKIHRQAMERYAANPVDHATLILRSSTWRAGKIDKLIQQVGIVIKCETPKRPEVIKWVMKRADQEYGSRISETAASLLVQRLGVDLMRLDSELSKVVLLAGKDQPVDTSHIEEVVGRSSDEQAWVIQEVILDALINRRMGEALGKIHDLVILASQAELQVTYWIADLVRKFCVAHMMQSAGVPRSQIARDLKLWGERQQLFFKALSKCDLPTASRLFKRVLEWDARAKSGRGDSLRNLECFCMELADNFKQ